MQAAVDQIGFIFFDDFNDISSVLSSTFKSVNYNKREYKDDGREARYYTIEKTSSNLNGVNGKYLLIFPCTQTGTTFDIENTKENKGNSKTLIIVIVVVVFSVIIIGLIIFFCLRRKKMQAAQMQMNQNYPYSTKEVNVQNNYPSNGNNNIQGFNNGPYNNVNVFSKEAHYNSENDFNNGFNK